MCMSGHILSKLLLYRDVLSLERTGWNELLDGVENEELTLQRQTKHVLQFNH